jgi:hypothetical protein
MPGKHDGLFFTYSKYETNCRTDSLIQRYEITDSKRDFKGYNTGRAVRAVHFIKARSLNSPTFVILHEVMGS